MAYRATPTITHRHANHNNNTIFRCIKPTSEEDISKEQQSKTFTVMLFDEEVVVNVTDGFRDTKHVRIVTSPRYHTPPNYHDTIDWFYHFRASRLRCLAVIRLTGDLLLSQQVQGERDEWAQYLEQNSEDVSAWRRRCLENDMQTGKEEKEGKTKPLSSCHGILKFINKICFWFYPK